MRVTMLFLALLSLLLVDSIGAGSSASASTPRMLHPTLSYDPGGAPYIWHRWLKPRSWADDDVAVTHARWTSWNAAGATARVRVDLDGVRGSGRVTLSSPGYCPAAHAYGFLEERDWGGIWGKGGTNDLTQLCRRAQLRTNDDGGGRRTWIGIYPRLYEPGVDAHYYRHPHGFRLDSSDQDIRFMSLRWRHWGGRTATAFGRAKACGEGNESEPFSCESRRVRLIAGDRGSCPTGGYLYQHLLVLRAPSLYAPRFEVPVAPQSCGPP